MFRSFLGGGLAPLPIAGLFSLWMRCSRPADAGKMGFFFGLGLFIPGIFWLQHSLSEFGGLPTSLSIGVVVLYAAFLALYPALAGVVQALMPQTRWRLCVGIPCVWGLSEWLRGAFSIGFPWLTLGYSQADTPLSSLAPIGGVYLVSTAVAVIAALLVCGFGRPGSLGAGFKARAFKGSPAEDQLTLVRSIILLRPLFFKRCILTCRCYRALAGIVALYSLAIALQRFQWVEPVGKPIRATLLQGNIPQNLKWNPVYARLSLERYYQMVLAARGQLIILPETAFPMFIDQLPSGYLARLQAAQPSASLLFGLPAYSVDQQKYYNSALLLQNRDRWQWYRKVHLVPFGEYVPLRAYFGWIMNWLSIPLDDFSRGEQDQPLLMAQGQRIAATICFEDVFGGEWRAQAKQATLLVNVSNLAWFGNSIALPQHLQIARFRALEMGRPVLRATNTGATALIQPTGEVQASLPYAKSGRLEVNVMGYQGNTPFLILGDAVMVLWVLGIIGSFCGGLRMRRRL